MPELMLDHLVIAVNDLEAATADYTALLGREPSWRGDHPKHGTRNTLFRIENTYVELLAPGDKGGRWTGELKQRLEKGEGLYALALGTENIEQVVRDLRERDIGVEKPADGEGLDQISGARRFWRNAMMPAKATNGVRLFFIQHFSPADALPTARPLDEKGHVRRLDHAVVLSPDLEQARKLWSDTLGVRLALDRTFPERNSRILFYRLHDVTVEISGGAAQTEEGMGKPDRLWGVAWGVDDLAATVARLRRAGLDVSEPRGGVKPGTLVATAKGPQTHGVATLLIEHTPESFRPESRGPHGAAYDNDPGRRAFTATGLHHVALAVEDLDQARATWRSVLGVDADQMLESPAVKLGVARLAGGDAMVGLAQALSSQHRVAEWITQRGPGMFAIAIQVDDVDGAVRDLRAKGVPVSDAEFGAWQGTRVARIDAAAANGVSIQLVQQLPDVI